MEVTGGYEVILPLIIVAAISTTICHYVEPASFYLQELVKRGPIRRPRTDAGILANLSLKELVERDCIRVTQNMVLRDFFGAIRESSNNCYPVEDEETDDFLGMISLEDIKPYLHKSEIYDTVPIGQIMNIGPVVASPDDDLSEILSRMEAQYLSAIPVVAKGKFIGMLAKATVLERYRQELIAQTRHLRT